MNAKKYRDKATRWQKRYNSNVPKLGEPAPDFSLKDTKGENQIKLSDFRREKPVVLIFGSFT